MKRQSKRFTPSRFSEFVVPFLLILLVIGLAAIIVLIGLVVAGVLPGG